MVSKTTNVTNSHALPRGRMRLAAAGIGAALAAAMLVTGASPAAAAPESDQIPFAWGNGPNGQLGNGALTTDQSTPVKTTTSGALAGKVITNISSGGTHACALTSDGAAYCWGYQANGRLGDGVIATTSQTTPVLVSGFSSGVTQISAGNSHTCAVRLGLAYCWGSQANGRLGNGVVSSTGLATPQAVDASGALLGKTVTGIAAGSGQSCAVTSDGGAYCWGSGSSGRLGDGNTTVHNVPTPFGPLAGTLTGETAAQISTGSGSSCARTASGVAHCWGSNVSGEVGNNHLGVSEGLPVLVSTAGVLSGLTVTDISVGLNHACAVATGGAYCWGSGLRGRLGNGGTATSAVPVTVTNSGVLLGRVVSHVTAGGLHSCAATVDGLGACWGAADNGRLGNGTTTPDQTSPVAVTDVTGPGAKVRPVLAISASSNGGNNTPSGNGAFTTAVYGWTKAPGTVTNAGVAGPILSWTAPTYAGIPTFTSYQVLYRKVSGPASFGTFCQNLNPAITNLDLGVYATSGAPAGATCNRSKGVLVGGTPYQFQVLARNSVGPGRVSNTVLYTP